MQADKHTKRAQTNRRRDKRVDRQENKTNDNRTRHALKTVKKNILSMDITR